MNNQEALEIISSVLQRIPITKAEAAGLNAAIVQLKESLVVGGPLDAVAAEYQRQRAKPENKPQ